MLKFSYTLTMSTIISLAFQVGSRRLGSRLADAVLGRCFKRRRRKKLSAVGSLLNVESCDKNGTASGEAG